MTLDEASWEAEVWALCDDRTGTSVHNPVNTLRERSWGLLCMDLFVGRGENGRRFHFVFSSSSDVGKKVVVSAI